MNDYLKVYDDIHKLNQYSVKRCSLSEGYGLVGICEDSEADSIPLYKWLVLIKLRNEFYFRITDDGWDQNQDLVMNSNTLAHNLQ